MLEIILSQHPASKLRQTLLCAGDSCLALHLEAEAFWTVWFNTAAARVRVVVVL